MSNERTTAGKTANETRNGNAAANARPLVTVETLRASIESQKCKSAWARGVRAAALDMCDDLAEWAAWDTDHKPGDGLAGGVIRCATCGELVELLRNGAESWHAASWGGNGLIYDEEIAERYCTPGELKRTRGGMRKPNSREDWLDVQSRGMAQAAQLVARTWAAIAEGRAE